MTNPWTITAMTADDHAACVELWQNSEGIGDAPGADAFAAFVARNAGFSPVARADGQVVGALMASFDGIRGYFYRLAVARAWRRRGIASALVTQATETLRTAGADRINLHIFASNDAAIGFWRSGGFSRYDGLETWRRSWSA